MRYGLAFIAALTLTAASLPQGAPEQAGMSRERLARIQPAIQGQMDAGRLSGAVAMIARRGKVVYFEAFGSADKEAGKPMAKDTIFRIYSMSKAVTATAVMTLYEEGKFSLNDPISRYLPEFAQMKVAIEKTDPLTGKKTAYTVPAEHPITIRDLLRHTTGLSYSGPVDENGEMVFRKIGINGAAREGLTLAEMSKRIASAPLMDQPGTIFRYGVNMDVLGRLVEVVSGKPLDEYYAERIFRPLGMVDTGFYVPEEKWNRLAAMYDFKPEGAIPRTQGDEQTEGYKKKPTVFMGGAGLVSTATDYMRFVQMLLNRGELEGVRILAPKTVDLMSTDHLNGLPRAGLLPEGYGMGLTLAVNLGPGKTGAIGSEGEYNWAGAAGTAFWIDPKEQMTGVFMIQRMGDDQGLARRFKQLSYQAILE